MEEEKKREFFNKMTELSTKSVAFMAELSNNPHIRIMIQSANIVADFERLLASATDLSDEEVKGVRNLIGTFAFVAERAYEAAEHWEEENGKPNNEKPNLRIVK